MSEFSRDQARDMITASEARTDAKFAEVLGRMETMGAELMGEIKALNGKIETVATYTAGTKGTIIATGVGVVALLIGILAFGDQLFGLGLSSSEVADQAARRAVEEVRTYLQELRSQP
ncbi:MAG TPA: hypothetical protein VHG92_08420 [Afifellaceae bacterium]|nr:hypothetical protein [Afifellaceae bacterium]